MVSQLIYTVVSAYADGSRGVERTKQYGTYHNRDSAYQAFKKLVDDNTPAINKNSPKYARRRELVVQASKLRRLMELRKQMNKLEATPILIDGKKILRLHNVHSTEDRGEIS